MKTKGEDISMYDLFLFIYIYAKTLGAKRYYDLNINYSFYYVDRVTFDIFPRLVDWSINLQFTFFFNRKISNS